MYRMLNPTQKQRKVRFQHGKIKTGTDKSKNRRKIEDAFVDQYLTHDGESIEEAKERLRAEQKERANRGMEHTRRAQK